MGFLVLLRHGQSQWNLENRFTGFHDIDLSPQGVEEAKAAGEKIKGIKFDHVYTSTLMRAYRTAELAMEAAGQKIEHVKHDALRERDYGELTGLNKDEMRQKYGDEQVHIWRRSYNVKPPGGESLEDVVARVKPYYESTIKPLLDKGQNVLMAAHGNTLRAMLIILGEYTPETINNAEIATGDPIVFDIDGTLARRVKV
jgi:2,3-bisphosphoglycerate-dependent phosphoglycerate mutase